MKPLDSWKSNFPFDPTYGCDESQLRAITPPPGAPSDFDAFWKETFEQTMRIPLRIEVKPNSVPALPPGYECKEIDFDSFGGIRNGGWLLTPREGEILQGIVMGHGYGGRAGPGLGVDLPNTAWFQPCAPGFHVSARVDLPSTAAFHVIHGIASRETYIIRACVAALWSALSVLKEVCPQVGDNIGYLGESFGGGLGALALPWDSRFKRGHLAVPTFGHHPLRLQCPCNGSGEAVRLYFRRRPEVVDVLKYYDAATAATRIRMPMTIAPALFDPAVPPPGQWAVANAVPSDKHIHVFTAGHFDHPGSAQDYERLNEHLRGFFEMGYSSGGRLRGSGAGAG